MHHGHIIILCGPSGVGKGTIVKGLLNQNQIDINVVKSYTTRPPRARDRITNHYVHLTKEEFIKRMNNNDFFETNFYNNNYYGTLKSDLDDIIKNNHIGLLEQDIEHALVTQHGYPEETKIIFIDSPIEIIRQRLIKRGENDEEEITERLNIAKHELAKKNHANYIIENLENSPEIAINKIIETIKGLN